MRGPPGASKVAPITAALCSLLIAIGAFAIAKRGIDFGQHADEMYHVEGLRTCIQNLALWPERYIYHGLYFAPGAMMIAWRERALLAEYRAVRDTRPIRLPLIIDRYPVLRDAQDDARRWIDTDEYRLHARTFFLVTSLFALVWIHGAMRRLFPRVPFAAVAAVAFLATSWEWAYHARFIAVDTPLSQFLALVAYTMAIAWTTRRPVPFVAATLVGALAAGLALGCKATGCFVALPVILTAFSGPLRRTMGPRIALTVACMAIVVVTFVATTPGALFDAVRFHNSISATAQDYGGAWPGYPYYVADRGEHLARLCTWLFGAVPSPWMALAIPVGGVALAGWIALGARARGFTIVWGTFLFFFVGFTSGAHLMIVRNYVMLVPLLALGFGASIGWAVEKLGKRRFTVPLAIACVALFTANAAWGHYAAGTVRTTTRESILREVSHYLKTKHEPFVASSHVRAVLTLAGLPLSNCTALGGSALPGDLVMFYSDHEANYWPSNRPGFVARTFSSIDVNYDWYATWPGRHERDRIVVISRRNAATILRLDTTDYAVCGNQGARR